ncbi:MAG: CBS domain-containing protein [Acidobacteria bacterium]|nr:CBS domain-containing protein [Candidatus Sulfomarinibacter kjeldsenii]
MAKTPIVKKFMKKASRTFNENDEMAPCMSVLARSSFAAIPIVNDDNEVVGLLTEKDVMRTVINWAYDQRAGGSVGNYMSSLEVIVTPEMDLLTAARAFMECNFSCLPVLDEDRLVGRITRHDVLPTLGSSCRRSSEKTDFWRGICMSQQAEVTDADIAYIDHHRSRDSLSRVFLLQDPYRFRPSGRLQQLLDLCLVPDGGD